MKIKAVKGVLGCALALAATMAVRADDVAFDELLDNDELAFQDTTISLNLTQPPSAVRLCWRGVIVLSALKASLELAFFRSAIGRPGSAGRSMMPTRNRAIDLLG